MIICAHGISNNTNDTTKTRNTIPHSTTTTVLSPRPQHPLQHQIRLESAAAAVTEKQTVVVDASVSAADVVPNVEDLPGANDVPTGREDEDAAGSKTDADEADETAAADDGRRADSDLTPSSASSESLLESLNSTSISGEYLPPSGSVYVDPAECPLRHVTKKTPAALKPLTLMDVWVLDIAAKHTVAIFDFAKRHNLHDNFTSHLKRVRRTGCPQTVSILLCSIETDPLAKEHIEELIADDPLLCDAGPFIPRRLSVPATQAESTQQLLEWGEIWPITYIPLHAGPRGHLLPRRWTADHVEWARKGMVEVARQAAESKAKGELPIACFVANNFDPEQPNIAPWQLANAFDTRTSTGNTLCHSFRNLIAAVADLDCRGVRSGPLTPPTARGATLPYLLTRMTLFSTHEPCLLCSMALLHSRVQYVIYAVESPGAGGCGSLYDVHEDEGLNHKFEVWHWKEAVEGLEVVHCDP